jgi:hypothetical protein
MRGLMASFDIQAEDSLVTVPRAMSFTLAPKQRCPFPEFVDPAFWGSAPWYLKLALMALHAKRQGPEGKMQQYVQQLPERVDVPVLWTDDQLQALQYPHLIHKVRSGCRPAAHELRRCRPPGRMWGGRGGGAGAAAPCGVGAAADRATDPASTHIPPPTPPPRRVQVKEQRRDWEELHKQAAAAQRSLAPVSQQELFWAMSCVRSRSFSGPYIGSTLSDRLRLGGLVGGLVALNTLLGLADIQKTLSAAIAVFVFNLL